MRGAGQLPRIGVLLGAICVLLLTPLVVVNASSWRQASSNVETAEDLLESTERLQLLLRLSPALSNEQVSATWVAITSNLNGGISNELLATFGFDFGANHSEHREEVNRLVSRLDGRLATIIESQLSAARQSVDGANADPTVVSNAYTSVGGDVSQAISFEMATLRVAAGEAGDSRVIDAAEVAETAAELQQLSIQTTLRWGYVAAEGITDPSAQRVIDFEETLALYGAAGDQMSKLVDAGSTTGAAWTEFTRKPETAALNEILVETNQALTEQGVPDSGDGMSFLSLSQIDLSSAFSIGRQIVDVLDMSRDTTADMGVVVEAALEDVSDAASDVARDAQAERRNAVLWIALSSSFVALAVGGLVLAVSRPLRRLAETVERVGRGQLDAELAEEGPKELRMGAKAFNNALESLRLAEAQAIALAEERLDDPVLDQQAPGALGSSLQGAVVRLARSLNDRERMERKLSYDARHDSLTRLANRAAILERLEDSISRSSRTDRRPTAVMFIDVDDFKNVNDLYGHRTGDVMLEAIARRIASTVRGGDLAGRMGGDEFVVIAEEMTEAEALDLAGRLLDAVIEPIEIGGTTHHPGVSIGVSLAAEGVAPDEALRDADLAVYRAKSSGKHRIDLCDDHLRREVEQRTAIEHDLREAIDHDQLVLYYQPVVESSTHRVRSLEALVRWVHPDKGLVPPDEFIPVAERSDLILDVDMWVVRKVAAQLVSWQQVPQLAETPIAVNISARHLSQGTLAAEIARVFEAAGAPTSRLIVELTETALLDDIVAASADIAALRNLGIEVALDDFGTGYMSVMQLRSLSVDTLKIDRSFVAELADPQTYPLVKLMVDIGHLLGVRVTAEGIETDEQAASMTLLGSDQLQGFLFARPADPVDLQASLALAYAR